MDRAIPKNRVTNMPLKIFGESLLSFTFLSPKQVE